MKIRKTIETEEGNVQFEGELNQDELDFILSIGLNYLFKQGAIPFKVSNESERASLQEPVETSQ